MPIEENLCTLSYSRGPGRPLLELAIGDLLHRTADRFGDRLAVASCHQSKRLTAWRAGFGRWAFAGATGWGCGPPTASSGS